jgi:hypothetical protein
VGKAQRLRRLGQGSTPTDPLPTLNRLRAWSEAETGAAWDASALLVTPEEAAEAGFTLSHAGRVSDGCWACWRYTAEAMAALVADEPIPNPPSHWERYCREWWPGAFDGQ